MKIVIDDSTQVAVLFIYIYKQRFDGQRRKWKTPLKFIIETVDRDGGTFMASYHLNGAAGIGCMY